MNVLTVVAEDTLHMIVEVVLAIIIGVEISRVIIIMEIIGITIVVVAETVGIITIIIIIIIVIVITVIVTIITISKIQIIINRI